MSSPSAVAVDAAVGLSPEADLDDAAAPDPVAMSVVLAKVLVAAKLNHMKKIGFVNVAEFRD